ncbi:MAG: antibiotic biosynthesis monooxygenase [Muribaculaceae bacterium]|nr:antibiotic biosynthesis monooxygenase [Muribaculaceae bacterium]
MIRLNCFIKVTEENRTAVLEAAKTLTAASLQQEGCIAYDVFESATRHDVLMICETWRDQAALEAHSSSQVFLDQVKIMQDLAQMKLESFPFNK